MSLKKGLNTRRSSSIQESVSQVNDDSPAMRCVESCRWRRSIEGDVSADCQLIPLLVPSGLAAGTKVPLQACRVCCQQPEPEIVSPGRVVASFVYGELQNQLSLPLDSPSFVRICEQLAWIELFLRTQADNSAPFCHKDSQKRLFDHLLSWSQRLRRLVRRTPRIGLVGSNNQKGLGQQNRDLAQWLSIDDWLLHSSTPTEQFAARSIAERVVPIDRGLADGPSVDQFLDRIDLLIFVERPFVSGLTRRAALRGIRTVCVPNWEWLHPGLEWLHDVDLMLCPTTMTNRMMEDWKMRFGFRYAVRNCSWPISIAHFPFRQRDQCQRFVMIHGQPDHPHRKGLDLYLRAAEALPDLSFLLRTQSPLTCPVPSNVEVRMAVTDRRELYEEGDICVQFSRWEGLGLPLLECQAAGLPLITIDAAPMNEHHPLDVVPVTGSAVLELWHGRPIVIPQVRMDDIVKRLRFWSGRRIDDASRAARRFVEQEHSWRNRVGQISAELSSCFWSRRCTSP